jgi:hypothetical protein
VDPLGAPRRTHDVAGLKPSRLIVPAACVLAQVAGIVTVLLVDATPAKAVFTALASLPLITAAVVLARRAGTRSR